MNRDNEDEYSLITENIVQKPWKKYKRTFGIIRLIVVVAVFGIVAGITFAVTSNVMAGRQNMTEQETLAIDRDMMPTDSAGNIIGSDDRQDVDFSGIVAGLKNNVDIMMASIVSVDCAKKNVDDFIADNVSETESVGIIIGDISRKYIILTDYNVVIDKADIVVKLSDSCQVDAEFLDSDEETGIAIISIKETDIPPEIRNTMRVSELDNSYEITSGEWVVMMGKLHGQNKAVEYTTITSIGKQSITDNITSIFNTGVARTDGDYGFMFNSSGNLVGINVSNVDDTEENTFTAYGVSDLKALVEALSNKRGISYLGIKGQRVTSDVSVSYQLPVGLFVSEIIVDSPAYYAGLQMGDVITEIDGNVVQTFSQLNEKLGRMYDGQQMNVTVMRMGRDGYNRLTYNVTINKR